MESSNREIALLALLVLAGIIAVGLITWGYFHNTQSEATRNRLHLESAIELLRGYEMCELVQSGDLGDNTNIVILRCW